MQKTAEEFKLDYSVMGGEGTLTVLIAAAGASTRMNGINKQFAPLLGIPVLARTLLAFERCSTVGSIIVAAAEDTAADVSRLCGEYSISKLAAVVKGGASRLDSVYAAACAAGDAEYIAVHDGARPLVSDALIKRVAAAAEIYGAAAPGVPLKDTVKETDADGFVKRTPRRESLAAVQTPQIFKADIFLPALRRAYSLGSAVTDDCSLLEDTGRPVKIVEGDVCNIKITTPEDITAAEAYLLSRGEKA